MTTLVVIFATLALLAVGYYLVLTTGVMRLLPPEGKTTLDGITTVDDAVKVCRASEKTGWELVAYAQQLAARKFSYSRCNPWDSPARAFARGMGYCQQQALALKLIYDQLGIESWPVQAIFNYFPPSTVHGIPETGGVSGHVWLQVRMQGEVRDVCPGNTENQPGVVHFRSLSPVGRMSAGFLLFSHLGSTLENVRRDKAARRWLAQHTGSKEEGGIPPKPGFVYRGERQLLVAAAREVAPGCFVDLPEGMVHYEIGGPPEGTTVVLVPGFSVPYYVWDPTFAALTQAGLRVLRYDLFGRGYSDRLEVVYDLELFMRQLNDLLAALGVNGPVDLIGLSMGGPIVAGFTDRYPQMVRKLGLIDPVGFVEKRSMLAGFLQMPLLGERLMSWLGERLLVGTVLSDLYHPEQFPEYRERYRVQMQYQGFKGALLSTLRFGPLGDMCAVYARVGAGERPILLIWGQEDKTIPFKNSKVARQVIPEAEFHAIEKAGHVPHYERPEVVNPILIRFLVGQFSQ